MRATAHCRQALLDEFSPVRQDLHRHPELAFEEFRTSAKVAGLLSSYGLDVHAVGATGIVATLAVGSSTRSIGLRADMDALPIVETSGAAHRSANTGVMHACGHDGHTTMLLAAAKLLSTRRNFEGRVHFIFQPAEEVGVDSGAQRMIAQGLFEHFPCDAVFAMHVHPGLPVGHFMSRPGAFMAAGDRARIRVTGKGGHAARPHLAIDAGLVASQIVVALQSIVARNVKPGTAAVVSVGRLAAGTTFNVIPNDADIELSIRSFDEATRRLLQQRITELAVAQGESFGAKVEVDYRLGYPVLVNDPKMTALAMRAATDVAGVGSVNDSAEQIMGSEDFAFMLNERPGCLVRIGNGEHASPLHHPTFDFVDDNIPTGAMYLASLVHHFFNASPN